LRCLQRHFLTPWPDLLRVKERPGKQTRRRNATRAIKAQLLPAQAIDAHRDALDGVGAVRSGWGGAQADRKPGPVTRRLKNGRAARAPLSRRGARRDLDALLAMAHAIRRHEFMTLGTANHVRGGGRIARQ
jgi:hypothetical protein